MGFDLLKGIEDNSYHDQQRRTTKKRCKGLCYPELLCYTGQNTDERKEDGSRQGDAVHHLSNIVCRRLTRLDAGDEPVVLLQAVGHLLGVKNQRSIEEGKCDDHDNINQHVPNVAWVIEDACNSFSRLNVGKRKKRGQEHDGLGKNDGHDTGGVYLEGQELPGATY